GHRRRGSPSDSVGGGQGGRAMSKRPSLRSAAGLTVLAAALATAMVVFVPGTFAVTGAGFTTVAESVDGSGHCFNGNPAINCNIYDGKKFVWLNGGPATAQPGAGTYVWAVLSPGGQPDPNDGAPLRPNGNDPNLSDNTDASTNRQFSSDGTNVVNLGTHTTDGNKIRVGIAPAIVGGGPDWFADTPNPGGVYILAICQISTSQRTTALTPTPAVVPKDCKY